MQIRLTAPVPFDADSIQPRDKTRRPSTKQATIQVATARKFIATQKGK